MSNLEHYFENLLFEGCDVKGNVNKNTLTKEEIAAVETCAQYVIYSLFNTREEFEGWLKLREYIDLAGWANFIKEEKENE